MVDFLHTVREIFFLNQPQNDFSSAHPRTDNIGCVPESFAWLLSWSFFCFVFAWNSYELVERHGVICIRPFFFFHFSWRDQSQTNILPRVRSELSY